METISVEEFEKRYGKILPAESLTLEEFSAKYPAAPSNPETAQNQPSPHPQTAGGAVEALKSAGGYINSFFQSGPVGLATEYAKKNPSQAAEAAASFVKNVAQTPIQLARAGVAGAAGLAGNEELQAKASKPVNIPLIGEVEGLSANPQDVERYGTKTPGETLAQAANMYLEAGAPGAGNVIRKATGAAGRALGPFSKWAERLSNTPAKFFDDAARPSMAKRIEGLRDAGLVDSPETARDIGSAVFEKAKEARTAAMDAYKATRDAIIAKNQGKIIQRAKSFVDNVQNVLKKNKIKITEDGVDLVGSQFEGSGSAKAFLDRAHAIMTRPIAKGAEAVDDLLTRREALSSMVFEIPVAERNLKRVVNGMRAAFDSTLDDVLGETASELRSGYEASMKPTESVISAMTNTQNGKRVFSQDRARRFIQEASSGKLGFDKREMLAELDGLVGSNFEETVRAIGIEKAISRLDPPTAGRMADVVKSFISKGTLGVITPLFSPKFWGEIALGKGMQATKAAASPAEKSRTFTTWLLTNLLTLPVREGISPDEK